LGILFNNYTIVFIGFSLDDESIKSLLRLTLRRNPDIKHYIILSCSEESDLNRFKELEKKYHLGVIFYNAPKSEETKQTDYDTHLNKLLEVLYSKKPDVLATIPEETRDIPPTVAILEEGAILNTLENDFIRQYNDMVHLIELFNQEWDENNEDN